MKVSEKKRELLKIGCYVVREGASHEIWYSPLTNKKFPVPRHGSKELPAGTAAKIDKDAGIK